MRKEDEKNEIVPYERTEYAKSNILIGAKYKSSILENKLMALGLSMITNGQFYEEEGKLTVVMYASQLRKKLRVNKGSFYQALDTTSKNMTGRVVGISDPASQSFQYMAVVTDCVYQDGVYKIMFNNSLREYIQGLGKNFTLLNLTTMLDFDSVYSFRLYELLKSRAFYPKGVNGKAIFHIEFGLTELKLDLGVINAASERVRTHLTNVKSPDFEKISEFAQEQQFKRWSDFKMHVLDVATKEINEKTEDMIVTYGYVQSGKGSRVQRVTFDVDLDTKLHGNYEEIPIEEKETEVVKLSQEDVLEKISDIIDEPLKVRDLKVIAEAAENDISLIEKAYAITKEKAKRDGIDDLVGYLIGVIKGGAREKIKVEPDKKGKMSSSAANYLNRYSQREYTKEQMLELERAMLRRSLNIDEEKE